jgi:hypothetical protein
MLEHSRMVARAWPQERQAVSLVEQLKVAAEVVVEVDVDELDVDELDFDELDFDELDVDALDVDELEDLIDEVEDLVGSVVIDLVAPEISAATNKGISWEHSFHKEVKKCNYPEMFRTWCGFLRFRIITA